VIMYNVPQSPVFYSIVILCVFLYPYYNISDTWYQPCTLYIQIVLLLYCFTGYILFVWTCKDELFFCHRYNFCKQDLRTDLLYAFN